MLALGSSAVCRPAGRRPAVQASAAPKASASQRFRAPRSLPLLARRLALGVAAAAASTLLHPASLLAQLAGGAGGAAGGAGGSRPGGGGGGGGQGRWHGVQPALADFGLEEEDDGGRGPQPAAPAAGADEDDEEKFLCEGIKAKDLPSGPGIPTKVKALAALRIASYRGHG